MAKRIINLNETTTIEPSLYFIIDGSDLSTLKNATYKISFETLKNAIIGAATNVVLIEAKYESNFWYRVWSDGWCELGGSILSNVANGQTLTISLKKKFKDNNYFIQVTRQNPSNCGSPTASSNVVTNTKTTTSFGVRSVCKSDHTSIYWEAKGKIDTDSSNITTVEVASEASKITSTNTSTTSTASKTTSKKVIVYCKSYNEVHNTIAAALMNGYTVLDYCDNGNPAYYVRYAT